MTIEEDYYGDANYGGTTDNDKHDETEDLASGLPIYLPSGKGTGHYNLLWPVGDQVTHIKDDIAAAAYAAQVQEAETIERLAELGALFEAPPEENEDIDHYRARLLAEGRLATAEGTIEDVIDGTAEILDISVDNVEYSEPIAGGTENGTASVSLPSKALDGTTLTASEIADYLDKLASVGCRIEGIVSGTFTYLSTSDYTGSGSFDSADLNSDSTKGYDGLDGNGDPKDNGGTYAGAI